MRGSGTNRADPVSVRNHRSRNRTGTLQPSQSAASFPASRPAPVGRAGTTATLTIAGYLAGLAGIAQALSTLTEQGQEDRQPSGSRVTNRGPGYRAANARASGRPGRRRSPRRPAAGQPASTEAP